LGNFQIATVGMQAAAVIGELWCTYDVELIKPKLPDAFSSSAPTHFAHDVTAYGQAALSSVSMYGAGGNKWKLLGNSLAGVSLDVNTMTFQQAGRYCILFMFAGTSAAAAAVLNELTVAGPISVVNLFSSGSATRTFQVESSQATLAGQTACALALAVDVGPTATTPPTLEWTASQIIPGGTTLGDIFVIPLPSGFSTPVARLEERFDTLVKRVAQLELEVDVVSTPFSSPMNVSAPRVDMVRRALNQLT
jgi:hypothetical protein